MAAELTRSDGPPPRPGRTRVRGALRFPIAALPWAVVGIAAIEAVALGRQARRSAPDDDWRAAAADVAGLRNDADALAVAPAAVSAIGLARLGAAARRGDAATPDFGRYARAIEVAVGGERAPDLAAWTILSERPHGALIVRTLRNPRHDPVLMDLVDRVRPGTATVARGPAGGMGVPCGSVASPAPDLPGAAVETARFQCGGDALSVVAPGAIVDLDGRVRRCLVVVPGTGAVQVRLPAVPLGDRMVGHVGTPRPHEATGDGAFRLTVSIDGAAAGEAKHSDGEGWRPFEWAIPGGRGRVAEVALAVEIVRGAGIRPVCVEASVR